MTTNLTALLEARSVAILGASGREGSFGNRLVQEVLRSSADLDVHLINPRGGEIEGRKVAPSLDDVDGPVDLVLFGVSDGIVEDEVRRAIRRGDRAGVLYGSLFDPADGSSTGLRERITTLAERASMQICGGGCMGFINVDYGLRAIGYVEREEIPQGPIAFVTHSGSVFSALLRTRRALGFSLAVSAGQELVTGVADYVDYALSLEKTKVVALFLETMRNPLALAATLQKAADQDVAVVALTVGASAMGQSMVAAHSGALAGADGAWEALFNAYGVIRVRDLDELTDTVELFSSPRRARAPRPGSGIATVHDSGAERALVVDIASEVGINFAGIDETTKKRLSDRLDPGLVAENPIDVWGTGADTEDLFFEVLSAMADDDNVDAVGLSLDFVTEFDGDESYPHAIIRAAEATTKPLVVISNITSAIDEATSLRVREAGIPVLEGTRSGLTAVQHLLQFPLRRKGPEDAAVLNSERQGRWTTLLRERPLSSAESFSLLAEYGVPIVRQVSTDSQDSVVNVAQTLGYPLVLKTDEEGIDHKSDVGGVVLGIPNQAKLIESYQDLARRLGPRVVLAQQERPGVELSLGIINDPHLGPLLVLGAGGELVEVMADRLVRLPTLKAEQIVDDLEVLHVARLFEGVRGSDAINRAALTEAVRSLATLAVELEGVLSGLDINPLNCTAEGVKALDVLILR